MYSLLVYNFFLLKPILCLSEWYDVGLLEALLYHLINTWGSPHTFSSTSWRQTDQIRYAPHHSHNISCIELSRLSPGNMWIKQDLLIT